jgi:hypothetical protein
MNSNEQKKSLIKINENKIFYKIKNLFKKLFYKNKNADNAINEKMISDKRTIVDNKKAFSASLKKIESEETKLLALQKRYRNGEIKEEDLSEEQINLLNELYDKQIAYLKKSNKERKQKLLQYHMKMKNS